MSRSLELSFQSASAKYSRLSKKVKKSIARGEFWRFTSRKRNHILSRIEKLRRRLWELQTQIKFAGVGIAAAAILGVTSADAQTITTVGPFQSNPLKNPLPPPAFPLLSYPEAQYRDFDGDGDLDAVVTAADKSFYYFKNVGNKTTARFEQGNNYYFDFSFPGPTGYGPNPPHTTFADLDDDGDLDMVALPRIYSTSYGATSPLLLYENASENEDPFFRVPDITNPLPNNLQTNGGWPSFIDIDKDGDQDLIVAGRYSGTQYIQLYRNEKVGHAAGVWPTFKQIVGSANPLQWTDESPYESYGVSFADIDGDGDQDFFYQLGYGGTATIGYRRNDNGTFVEQEGTWQYNSANPGQSTGNPFNIPGLTQLGAKDGYRSLTFADLDGDGDLDATLGINTNDITPQSTSLLYFENDGKGGFTHTVNKADVLSGTRVGNNASSTLQDWDGDGDLDIVVLNNTYVGAGCEEGCEVYNYNLVPTVFLFNDGKFTPPTGITLNPLPPDVPNDARTYYRDLDGDGDFDLLIWRSGDGYREFYYYEKTATDWVRHTTKDGNNPFTFAEDFDLPYTSPGLGDIDGDGLADFVLTSTYDPPRFYKNTGTIGAPQFEYNEAWGEGAAGYLYSNTNPSFVDIDSDGDLDLVTAKYDNIWYYENQGDKTNPKFRLYYNYYNESNPQYWGRNPFSELSFSGLGELNLADIDGDGDKDLLYINTYNGTFQFYENQNPAPTVNAGNTTLQFTRNTALKLSSTITITDSDKDKIVKVTAKIAPYTVGQEKLNLTGTHGKLTSEWDNTVGQLTITGSDTITVWQDALRSIEYLFTGPAAGRTTKSGRTSKLVQKTVTVTSIDADLTVAPSNTATFSITGDDGTGAGNVRITPPHKTASPGGNIVIIVDQVVTVDNSEIDMNSILATSQQGKVTISNGIVTVDYKDNAKFTGIDVVTLTVCDLSGECATEDIPVKIDPNIKIYTGMSPNGDNINDWFHVDFLPENCQVAIYNRWGEIIYEEKNYNVDDEKRRFEGLNKNGTEVIAGSYFYKIKVVRTDGSSETKSGPLLISR